MRAIPRTVNSDTPTITGGVKKTQFGFFDTPFFGQLHAKEVIAIAGKRVENP